MKENIIKWIGTIVIITISVILAFNMTSVKKVYVKKLYVFDIIEHSYELKDGRKAKFTLSLGSYNKEETERAKKDVQIIIPEFSRILETLSAADFKNTSDLLVIKAKLLLQLNELGYSIETTNFKTFPIIY
jgi:hypothetical protein